MTVYPTEDHGPQQQAKLAVIAALYVNGSQELMLILLPAWLVFLLLCATRHAESGNRAGQGNQASGQASAAGGVGKGGSGVITAAAGGAAGRSGPHHNQVCTCLLDDGVFEPFGKF